MESLFSNASGVGTIARFPGNVDRTAFVFVYLALLASPGMGLVNSQVEVVDLPRRHAIVANVLGDPQSLTERTVIAWISCLTAESGHQSQTLAPGQSTSFILGYGPRCIEPVVVIQEMLKNSSGSTTTATIRLVPRTFDKSPAWVAPLIAATLSSLVSLVSVFAGARLAGSREARRLRIELQKDVLLSEYKAYSELIRICKTLPDLSTLDSALSDFQRSSTTTWELDRSIQAFRARLRTSGGRSESKEGIYEDLIAFLREEQSSIYRI